MRARSRLALCTLATASVAFACQVVAGYEAFDEAAPAPKHACDILPVTKQDSLGLTLMARVNVATTSCVWIDRTEVTVKQYAKWQATVPADSESWEPTWCRWKTRRTDPIGDPNDSCTALLLPRDLQPFAPDKPMRCVDFCEAEAFCRFADKHLCHDADVAGVQGPRGPVREWELACTNQSTTIYPWGNDAQRSYCNSGHEADTCITTGAVCGVFPAGQQSNCANRNAVVDLLGNVAEWVFSCNLIDQTKPPAPSGCMTRGGGYDAPLEACDIEYTQRNDTRLPSLGFRCCADLTPEEELAVASNVIGK